MSRSLRRRMTVLAVALVLCSNFAHAQWGQLPQSAQMSPPAGTSGCHNCDGGVFGYEQFKGWVLTGSAPEDYLVGYESNNLTYAPKITGRVSSKPDAKGEGFGTIMQKIPAADYRGGRLRFSALLRTRDVEKGAGMWLRVDGPDGKVLAFDNMQSRPIVGTQQWKRYDIVVDVPEQSTTLAYGVLLIGTGTLGINELRLEKVGKDVAVTETQLPKAPVNLDLKIP